MVLIIFLFVILFIYLFFYKEKFTNFGLCENATNVNSISYELIDDKTMELIKESLSNVVPKKITYSCPDPNAEVGPPGVEPTPITGVTYGFDPSDIQAIDSKLGTNFVKKVTANGKQNLVVSNVDMMPLLVAYIKMQKMGGASAAEKATNIETKLAELEEIIDKMDKWKKDSQKNKN